MLYSIYPYAVENGIKADEFWVMTFDEIMTHITATIKRHRTALRERAVMDHKTAELMAFAVNDPSKMPSVDKHYGFMDENKNKQKDLSNVEELDQTEPEDWQNDQAILMQQAMAVKATNQRKNKN